MIQFVPQLKIPRVSNRFSLLFWFQEHLISFERSLMGLWFLQWGQKMPNLFEDEQVFSKDQPCLLWQFHVALCACFLCLVCSRWLRGRGSFLVSFMNLCYSIRRFEHVWSTGMTAFFWLLLAACGSPFLAYRPDSGLQDPLQALHLCLFSFFTDSTVPQLRFCDFRLCLSQGGSNNQCNSALQKK